MLDAASKNKLRIHINSEHRKNGLLEDEFTSTIFGPLAYMSAEDAWFILRNIAVYSGISSDLIQFTKPYSFAVNFWPKQRKEARKISFQVEPDLVLSFIFSDGSKCSFLLEMKYGDHARLTPDCELIRQWSTRPDPESTWYHIYIGRPISYGRRDLKKSAEILENCCSNNELTCCDKNPHKFPIPLNPIMTTTDWRRWLRALSWNHIHEIAGSMARTGKSDNIKRWGSGVSAFLEKHDFVPFVGFEWLSDDSFSLLDEKFVVNLFEMKDWLSFLSSEELIVLDQTQDNIFFM